MRPTLFSFGADAAEGCPTRTSFAIRSSWDDDDSVDRVDPRWRAVIKEIPMTRSIRLRRTLVMTALAGACSLAPAHIAAAQDSTPTTQLDLSGGATATTQPEQGTTPTTQLDLGGTGSAAGATAPSRIDAGAGGTAADGSASYALAAFAAVGAAAVAAAGIRARRAIA
jgi:hypothetical protein